MKWASCDEWARNLTEDEAGDTYVLEEFPPPPSGASTQLVPLRSWVEVFDEAFETGIEFDDVLYKRIEEGGAYLYHWRSFPFTTVLVLWDEEGITDAQVRSCGRILLEGELLNEILAELNELFAAVQFVSGRRTH